MPLQNRVDPLGQLHAVSSRGIYTGNRGVIHNADKKIVRQYANKRWIYCKLKYKDHHREVMTPNRWTELFFLDDATALSAGHRPCAYVKEKNIIALCQHVELITAASIVNAIKAGFEV